MDSQDKFKEVMGLLNDLDRIAHTEYKDEDHGPNHQTFAKVLRWIMIELYDKHR